LTLKVGGSFIKLTSGEVTIVGDMVKINSGGSPGTGSDIAPEEALLPGESPKPKQESVQNVQGGAFFNVPEPEPEAIPGRKLSKDEYCKYVFALQNSQVFRDTLKRMAELTKKNNVEYSCWFVQDSDGSIRAVNMRTDDAELWVAPGAKPEGAIGQVHTHTRSIFPSPDDYQYFSTQPLENRPYVYGIMVKDAKEPWMVDDEGQDISCGMGN
jgi:hypothetical protein